MITQKIIYDNDTGKIKEFQEYKDNVLTTTETYNEMEMVIQRNYPMDNSMVKLFFDNEYWYVLKKTSYIKTMHEVFHVTNIIYDENDSLHRYFSYRVTKYSKKDTPNNPIEENLVITIGSRIEADSEECTQLCTPIDNDKAVVIIKELFTKDLLKKYDILGLNKDEWNKQKLKYTKHERK